MADLRDKTIKELEMTVEGRMSSARASELNERLSALTSDQLSLVRAVVASSIDDVLHNALWMLEQHDNDLQLSLADGTKKANLVEISDGLAGELHTEAGWIARFSRYKESY